MSHNSEYYFNKPGLPDPRWQMYASCIGKITGELENQNIHFQERWLKEQDIKDLLDTDIVLHELKLSSLLYHSSVLLNCFSY